MRQEQRLGAAKPPESTADRSTRKHNAVASNMADPVCNDTERDPAHGASHPNQRYSLPGKLGRKPQVCDEWALVGGHNGKPNVEEVGARGHDDKVAIAEDGKILEHGLARGRGKSSPDQEGSRQQSAKRNRAHDTVSDTKASRADQKFYQNREGGASNACSKDAEADCQASSLVEPPWDNGHGRHEDTRRSATDQDTMAQNYY
mmetsp:Transcript_8021/g.14208  ORF Transcript_8021/g.14208 Transcript_8021/m.14208 type:complete len:203 (+) Transcript_8021:609-1217(+)